MHPRAHRVVAAGEEPRVVRVQALHPESGAADTAARPAATDAARVVPPGTIWTTLDGIQSSLPYAATRSGAVTSTIRRIDGWDSSASSDQRSSGCPATVSRLLSTPPMRAPEPAATTTLAPLTIRTPAGSPYRVTGVTAVPAGGTLRMLAGTVVLLPVILGYVAFVYWLFRGKVREGDSYH